MNNNNKCKNICFIQEQTDICFILVFCFCIKITFIIQQVNTSVTDKRNTNLISYICMVLNFVY